MFTGQGSKTNPGIDKFNDIGTYFASSRPYYTDGAHLWQRQGEQQGVEVLKVDMSRRLPERQPKADSESIIDTWFHNALEPIRSFLWQPNTDGVNLFPGANRMSTAGLNSRGRLARPSKVPGAYQLPAKPAAQPAAQRPRGMYLCCGTYIEPPISAEELEREPHETYDWMWDHEPSAELGAAGAYHTLNIPAATTSMDEQLGVNQPTPVPV
jgi:hypothetical protein